MHPRFDPRKASGALVARPWRLVGPGLQRVVGGGPQTAGDRPARPPRAARSGPPRGVRFRPDPCPAVRPAACPGACRGTRDARARRSGTRVSAGPVRQLGQGVCRCTSVGPRRLDGASTDVDPALGDPRATTYE
ncbi:hypothetical protein ADK55_11150 [Streptomyces sp. WM4235]|nr:hypothetical protein ADK55_11150 [Streptomyces sp. WM4235]